MTANELRKMYVQFFEERGHKEIASASLLPDNDPTVLFTTAGMHPLVPYLLGEKHPQGKRLVNVQKCVRTCDIDEVGDDTHLTYFEMLGNWSLGDYDKKESISMSYEFLTTKLNIPVDKLAVTVFQGDEIVPMDKEAATIWKEMGISELQIFFYGREENWWGPAGKTGPCGSDTEIFYDMGKPKCSNECGPACKCGKYVEIWNNVFMQYNKEFDGTFTELVQKNVDTGMGLERVLTILNGFTNVYETELFTPIVEKINEIAFNYELELTQKDIRIIAEHARAICFILGDPKMIIPSNTEQGYILRRLIRRVIGISKRVGINENILSSLANVVVDTYKDVYSELNTNQEFILIQIDKEYVMFNKTLDLGLKKAEKIIDNIKERNMLRTTNIIENELGEKEFEEWVNQEKRISVKEVQEELDKKYIINGDTAFMLYDTFGFPIEFTIELAREKGLEVDIHGFEIKYQEHQEKSRQGAEGKFKGGLADNGEQTAKLHTATHLLNSALRKVLGDSVFQRGSNITTERLRFDFSYDRKLTSEEINEVSRIVNEAISKNIEVICEEMTLTEARDSGALGIFESKYGDLVKVYTIPGYSKEICGGPHAKNTRDLVSFMIIKEEASSAGVRRIKAIIGNG